MGYLKSKAYTDEARSLPELKAVTDTCHNESMLQSALRRFVDRLRQRVHENVRHSHHVIFRT